MSTNLVRLDPPDTYIHPPPPPFSSLLFFPPVTFNDFFAVVKMPRERSRIRAADPRLVPGQSGGTLAVRERWLRHPLFGPDVSNVGCAARASLAGEGRGGKGQRRRAPTPLAGVVSRAAASLLLTRFLRRRGFFGCTSFQTAFVLLCNSLSSPLNILALHAV